jgi:prevent-host-death family protein
MPEIIYNLDEAKTSLSHLVDRAARGEEIILSRAGKPLAKLVPYQQNPKPRQPGGWEGQVRISEDFDDLLPPENQASGLVSIAPPPDRSHEISISEALAEQRRER